MASLRSVPRTSTGPPLLVPAVGVLSCLAAVLVAAWLTRPRPVPGIPGPEAVVGYGVPTARAVLLVCITAVVGLSLLPGLLAGPRSEPLVVAAQRLHVLTLGYRAALLASVGWLAAALLAVVLQTAELNPGTGATVAAVVDYVRQFGGAQALVGAAVAALLAGGFAALGVRAPHGQWYRAMLIAAGLGLLPLVASTHSGELSAQWHGLSMISLELHVFGATAWLGGLAALAALGPPRPALLARALPRFSGLAALCLVTVAVSGLVNAVVELAGGGAGTLFTRLLTTDYGLLVLAKIGCLAVVLGIAGRVRFRLLPMIADRRPSGIALWLTSEVAVLGVALGLAAVLSRTGAG